MPDSPLYEAHPFVLDPARAEIISYMMNQAADFDILFPDDLPRCEARGEDEDVCGTCERCLRRKMWLSANMVRPDARYWEVWEQDEEMPVGLIYLSGIRPGLDAAAHYLFFDGSLGSKTPILQAMMDWFWSDHAEAGWRGLERITLEIPEHYFALARHASRKLGFGGPFLYKSKNLRIPVEGVRRNAYWHQGRAWNTLILGKLNPAVEGA